MAVNQPFAGGEAADALPDNLDFGNDLPTEEESDAADLAATESAADADAGDAAAADADAAADDADDTADGQDADADDAGAAADESEAAQDAEQPGSENGRKEPVIPKKRLDQALRKQRAAEQRALEAEQALAELRAAQAQAAQPKLPTSEEIAARMAEANEALIAGDPAKAAQIQAELMQALAARPEAPVERPIERDLADEVAARLEFKSTLGEIHARFPELDENHESFDEELSQEAVDLQQAYMNRGYSMAEATKKAAESVAKLYDLADRKAPPAPPARAAAARAEQQARSRDKMEKATRAAPTMPGRPDAGDEVAFDVRSATPEEWAALPESVKERLLGNSL
jgi:hypothetical protein